ncbi:MAG: type IV pilus assembly protein PilM [Planctomycetota bacterium]|nr:type IV pilus assembly protein PilM [Planctomycetota bacterium]
MARPKSAWGLEVGAAAIKAIRLTRNGDEVSVSDFKVIAHRKALSTPDVDQNEMIRLSLGQLVSQRVLEGEHLVMSVPGHASFARFAKLPPVEPRKVPDVVKFEAVQQIPFPIEQVEWDYQTFASDDSPEIEVGIFAITRDRVQQRLSLYGELGIAPEALTLGPVAVYNAMAYDHNLAGRKGPVVYLDIGTYATDVIIAEQGRCWIRTFPLGGTHFTEAIVAAFKLSYSKAEKLKHEAAASKYTKQIMQAMRPVFSDLLQDLQRSIGYYQTLHRDAKLTTMVGLGSTFKIPGLRKFLGQQLQMHVLRLDEYKRIAVTGREAATFAQSAVSMATAYGLALQGLGLARINANLVPVKTLRAELWRQKTQWFAAAAAIVVLGATMMLYRPISDRSSLNPGGEPAVVSQVLETGGKLKRDFEQIGAANKVGFAAENLRRLVDYRDIWPHLVNDVAHALASTDPQPELLGSDVEKILAVEPEQRRLVELRYLGGRYTYDPEAKSRRIAVTMEVQLSHDRPFDFLNETVGQWLRDHAERPDVPYRILDDTISWNRGREQTITVSETGEEEAGGATRPSAPGGAGSPPGRRDRSPAPRNLPGSGAGGAGAGPGIGMTGGGDTPGRRARPSGRRRPPGPPSGGLGISRGEQPSASGGPRRQSRPGPRHPPGQASGRGEHNVLDAMGPVPNRPTLYPPNSKYYLVPITFEVELLDAPSTLPADTAAGRGQDRQEAAS